MESFIRALSMNAASSIPIPGRTSHLVQGTQMCPALARGLFLGCLSFLSLVALSGVKFVPQGTFGDI